MQRFANYIKTFILFATILSLGGCKKILEPTPKDFLDANTFYQKKANLNAALNGVYAVLVSPSLYGETYQCYITSGVEDAILFQGSVNNPKTGYYNESSSYAETSRFWANLYTGINRANEVLENLNTPKDITEDEKKIVEGETRFLRAYYYFLLTQWFGDVPLRNESSKYPEQTHMAFTDSKEVYEFVLAEMQAAEQLLAAQTAGQLTNSEKITQTAVQAILARVCLYMAGEPVNDQSKYTEAVSWCKKVISSGLHRLNPSYTDVFKQQLLDLYDNIYRESIWEVGFYVNITSPEMNSGKYTRVGIASTNDIVGRNDGWVVVHPRNYLSYERVPLVAATGTSATVTNDVSPDTRRDWSISRYRYTGGTATTAPTKTMLSANNYWGRFSAKWRREEEASPHHANRSPANIPVIRYSDVLLMLAEAENELNGPTSEIVGIVNEIRARAYNETGTGKMLKTIRLTNGGSGYTAVPTVTITGGGATTAATAKVIRTGNTITAILLSDAGTGYTSLPNITISGGGGTGAAAEAVALTDYRLRQEQYLDKAAFRKTIQDERLVEFSGEFLRRQDLKRWGLLVATVKLMAEDAETGNTALDLNPHATGSSIPAKVHFTQPGSNISAKNIFLPIPLTEMLYNKFAVQNEGF